MKEKSQMIGARVEYQIGGRTYQGTIKDRVTISHKDTGQPFDLYIIAMDDGRIYRISPTAVKQIIPE